ncbi:hypothetical protein DQP55_09780 [Mycolicibacterium sp. GF69]|uniref:hypothetical protein n=1 Tax=Mycolicibacterium sp. GF69 TaxID=2267251 RepID=UPI000DCE3DE5|nr:hypothetical protein [Mycolicibacterium sp. GF69]RAV14005.1 hypothetical protein DQP55_09780 [Mycolicibacterium sp. GF69]
MEDVFVGSAALASGTLTRGQLRWNYRAMFPDVYTDKSASPQLAQRTVGAHLWSKRRAVIAGVAAAALHGARVDDQSVDVELICRSGRSPRGITVRNESIDAEEIIHIDGIPVTTVERTALDLGRHLPRDQSVAVLDALACATGVAASDVEPLFDRYRGTRGLRHSMRSLALMDGGSQSPQETATRLAMIAAGLPPPRTDFTITDGNDRMRVAMGYDAPMVGVVVGVDDSSLAVRAGWKVIDAINARAMTTAVLVRMAVIERGYPVHRLQQLARR